MKINVKIDKSLNQPEITISAQTEREAERIRKIVLEANKIRQKKIEAMDGKDKIYVDAREIFFLKARTEKLGFTRMTKFSRKTQGFMSFKNRCCIIL